MFKLHHIGIVLKNNIEEAVKIYCDIFGLSPSDERIQRFPGKQNKTVMIPAGDISIELMEPTDSESGSDKYVEFGKYVEEHGEGLFHLNFFTDNFDTEIKVLKEKGFSLREEEHRDFLPGHILRETYLRPKDTRGVWIALVDARNVPRSIGGLAE